MFKDVLPGEKTEFCNKGIKDEVYWDVNLEKKIDRGEDYYIENLNFEVESAIKRQLISDVPVGAFVSGGLDSSLILFHMSKYLNNINVFATGLSEKNYSELESKRSEMDYDIDGIVIKINEVSNPSGSVPPFMGPTKSQGKILTTNFV